MESTSNAAVMSLSGDKPRRKRTLDDKACEVCDDKSTGKHYGVYCCDGCSGFFKRTVRRSIPWLCRNNNQCVVDRASRTDCRACRFKKCLMVNMNPEATLTKMMPHLGVQTTSGSRVSYDRANRENDSSEMNYSDFEGTSVQTVHLRGNSSTSSVTLATNPSFPGSSSSPPISMALAGLSSSPDFQRRSDSPVLIKVETEGCDTYVEVEKNSEIVGNNLENIGHKTEHGRNSSEIGRNSSGIAGNTSTIVEKSPEIVGGTLESRNRNVSSSQVVREPTSTKTGMVIMSQPVRPVMPAQPQVVPTQMLVVPNTSFTHRYPYQSTHYPLTSPTPRYALTDRENVTPGGTEMSLRSKADSLQNMAVQLLSNSVQFAKNIPSFKSLPFRDQIILLEESWKDLFILDAAFWSFPLDVSGIVPPGDATLVSNLRVLQELVARIQALELDESECGYLKTVVLFKPDIKGLKDSQQVEKHQDEALVKLSDYVRTTRVESPARFGRLLLTLSAFERASQEMIEKLFFRAQNEGVEYILHDLFKKT